MMNHSLASKNQTLALIIVLIVSLFLLFPASVLFFNYRSSVIEEMSEQATIVASMTAHIVEQTIDDYRKLSETPDFAENPYDEAYYLRMNRLFAQLKAETGAEYIYTERRVGEESIEYILDAEIPDSENFSPIGVPDYLSEPEKKVYEERKAFSSGLQDYEGWGKYISGYAPIIDARDGSLVGLAGVDYSLAFLKSATQSMLYLIIFSFVLLLVLISVVMYVLISLKNESMRTDYLTKLNTKRFFDLKLRETIETSKATKKPFSLLMIDIDGFKQINDTFGHQFGDQILQNVSNAIRSATNPMDTCSRIGGDEFSVILPNTSLQTALDVASSIQCTLENNYLGDESSKTRITVSIGVAQWSPKLSAFQLIEQADQALYRAKTNGKNRVTD
ncbi:MAG: GGDEF domain-containing protein [Sphaerochaeta sp.]|nr:GGDEF domain-containing protein [Sphaerochaeta sp.]